MKYLLLLLAPLLLSISPGHQGSSTTLKLSVYNKTHCTAQLVFEACMNGTCSEKTLGYGSVDAGQERTLELSSEAEDGFICSALISFSGSYSERLTFKPSYCSGYENLVLVAGNCNGLPAYAKKVGESGNEVEIEIYYPR